MRLGLELIPHKVLHVLGFEGRGQLAFPEFLCVDKHQLAGPTKLGR